jgi:hypothetical protein
MPQTTLSTVIEIFIPEGFAHDYEWTTRALGMKHFAVWNDTYVPLFSHCVCFLMDVGIDTIHTLMNRRYGILKVSREIQSQFTDPPWLSSSRIA